MTNDASDGCMASLQRAVEKTVQLLLEEELVPEIKGIRAATYADTLKSDSFQAVTGSINAGGLGSS